MSIARQSSSWSARGLLAAALLWLAASAQEAGQGLQPSATIKRFEYKYSFKPPYLAQKDGSVPFFEYFGSEYLARAGPYKDLNHLSISQTP